MVSYVALARSQAASGFVEEGFTDELVLFINYINNPSSRYL